MTDSDGFLKDLMVRYRTDNLVGLSSTEFRRSIDAFLSLVDGKQEGYADPSAQRDLSIRFHWGHNHDFGEFALQGKMGDRHLWLLDTFMNEFRALPRDLTGCRVLDIGCWTGGTSLLLAAMGAEVTAIEEVRKYVDALNLLKQSFEVGNLTVQARSLYECNDPAFYDRFDYVLFAGVIYHLTDPVLGARIAYNALKDGGTMLVETMSVPNQGRLLEYWGPREFGGNAGTVEDLNRSGWNWFVPSPDVLAQMLRDAGLVDVETGSHTDGARTFAVGRRDHHRDINRAGLSVPRVR